MLVAMNEQQQLFHLTSKLPPDELQKLKEQQSFFVLYAENAFY